MDVTDDLDDFDLPWSSRHLLWVLEDAGGSLSRSELQDRTEMPSRTLDRALVRLENADLVRRDRDGHDLRFVRVILDENT